MASQCLDRRIPTKAIRIEEVKAWERALTRRKYLEEARAESYPQVEVNGLRGLPEGSTSR